MIRFNVIDDNISINVKDDRISLFVKDERISMTVESAVLVGAFGQIYDESYDITPTVEGLTIDTENKYMMDDVNVNPIPFFSVGNDSGGNTVYIGSEVEISGSK